MLTTSLRYQPVDFFSGQACQDRYATLSHVLVWQLKIAFRDFHVHVLGDLAELRERDPVSNQDANQRPQQPLVRGQNRELQVRFWH
jgi:hypothetical protein